MYNWKKAYLHCNGCIEARMETAQLEKFLELNGISIVKNPSEADVVLVYACGLTQEDAQLSAEIIKDIKSKSRKDADFIVWGCLPHIDPLTLRKVHKGMSFGRSNVHILEKFIDAKVRYEDVTVNYLFPVDLRRGGRRKVRDLTSFLEWLNYRLRSRFAPIADGKIYYIMTSRGCLGNCTFCSDKRSCGMIRSKPKERIVEEFKKGLEKGYKVFNLVATDLGAYGRDRGYRLDDLLREITAIEGDYKLILGNVNPYHLKEMFDGLEDIFKSGKVGLLGSSAQTGSNRLLKLMGRRYTVEEFKECITAVKSLTPKTLLWTQIMAGFPAETEEDFRETLKLLDEIKFDFVQVFKFSERPTVPASRLWGSLPREVVEKRYRRLLIKAIQNEILRKIERMRQ
ncbi:MAG: hypothetical protein DRJ37_01315 [Thermoprotei archaeon]|nr:MAG: hypothetical protein DRJ37_01315 [Thermoprotei archaeon]